MAQKVLEPEKEKKQVSVIWTGMDMPKSCGGCEASGTGVCRKWGSVNFKELGREKADDCPLKSVDELIERIKNIPVKSGISTEMDDGSLSAEYFQRRAIEVIKEFCGKDS